MHRFDDLSDMPGRVLFFQSQYPGLICCKDEDGSIWRVDEAQLQKEPDLIVWKKVKCHCLEKEVLQVIFKDNPYIVLLESTQFGLGRRADSRSAHLPADAVRMNEFR